jgi:hypothetical protein
MLDGTCTNIRTTTLYLLDKQDRRAVLWQPSRTGPRCSPLTGCEVSEVQTLLASAQIEGHSSRRERCVKKNAGDSEPESGTERGGIATLSGPYAAHALTLRVAVFSRDFKR